MRAEKKHSEYYISRLMDYAYFKNYYKLITADLRK